MLDNKEIQTAVVKALILVAIVPFVVAAEVTADDDTADIARGAIFRAFSALGYRDVSLDIVDRRLSLVADTDDVAALCTSWHYPG